jgi:cytochrome c-type biogenesis protein CcmH
MMTAFWVVSTLFIAGTLLFILPPLLARRERAGVSRRASNLAIHRDQLRELDADLQSGMLDGEHYENAKRELEARVLEDLGDAEAAPRPPGRGLGAAIISAVAIPLFAVTLYLVVGNPQALSGQAASGAAHGLSGEQVEALVARLAARMAQYPEDAEGWIMLGRSYGALGRFGEAAKAYTNAVERMPGDAALLADYADVLAMAQGRRLQGEPEKVLARALAADPENLKALALAGSAAFQKEDYAGALAHWERLAALVPGDSEQALAIRASIAEARSLAGERRQ